MRRANIVSGVVLVVLSFVTLWGLIPWQISAGPAGMMSPRLVPSMMMMVVLGLSCLLVFNNWREQYPSDPKGSPISRYEIKAVVQLGVIFAFSIGLFVLVSPLMAGLALMIGALLTFGERRLLILILLPAMSMLSIWLLFYKVLGTEIV